MSFYEKLTNGFHKMTSFGIYNLKMESRYSKAYITLVLIVLNTNSTNLTRTENDLHKFLFKDYNTNIMPKLNKTTPIHVLLDMYLLAIENIDERRQSITVRVFLEISWTDQFLTWNSEEFGGIEKINVKDEDIWVPDIALMNAMAHGSSQSGLGGRANVNYTGAVIIWPYRIYTVTCKIVIARFPFDRQHCIFDFVTWTTPTSVVTLSSINKVLSTDYNTESGEWDLLQGEMRHERRPYGPDAFDHVVYVLHIRRKSLFFVLNVILPVILIALLNILCFILPSGEGERVTLCISVFLTLAIFLTIVNSSLPESSDEVAFFNIYVGLQLIGSILTIVMTVTSLYYFFKDDNQSVPKYWQVLVMMTCLRASTDQSEHRTSDDQSKQRIGYKKDNGKITETVKMQIGWKMVSRAIDRLCFISSLIWHSVLLIILAVNVLSDKHV